MTKTLVIHATQRRLNRAIAYLELIEQSKNRYRNAMSDHHLWLSSPDDSFTGCSGYYKKCADRMQVLHTYLVNRYNNCVADSLIITI